MTNSANPTSELSSALKDVRQYFGYTGLFSAAVNLLMLVPIIYMLQVYDRAISSGSYSTLTMLTLLLVVMLAAMGIFEWARSSIMMAASNRIEQKLRNRVSDATFRRALLSGGMNTNAQPLQDLSQLRTYLTSQAPIAFFDTPWVPIYLALMYLFHPWFGVAATLAVIVMLGLTFLSEWLTNDTLQEANGLASSINTQVSSNLRNAEVIAAMGMSGNIEARQSAAKQGVAEMQTAANGRSNILRSVSKTFRMITQSLVLGLGAYLALQQAISPGMMIGGALLLGRALAPIDQLVGSWKGFSEARAQYDRLSQVLEKIPPREDVMPLPEPTGHLAAENLVVYPPNAEVPAVKNVSMVIEPGKAIGIVGPSASGKSTLARALLGIWPVFSGKVRLDGADIAQWDRAALGPHIGYLPQDIELFDGTIAENICRFGELDAEAVVAAAQLAGVHELVLQLSKGYDTLIGSTGGALSGGQRQRIALARAVYKLPRLVVLDEPNSNLDDQGEKALINTVMQLKANGSTVIVISHRVAILHVMDMMLILNEGQTAQFGPKEEVLSTLTAPRNAANSPGEKSVG